MKLSSEQGCSVPFHRALLPAAFVIFTLAAAGCPGPGGTTRSGVPASQQAGAGSVQAAEVLATIDGEPVTGADLEELAGDQLALMDFQYRSERQQLIEAAVREVVRSRLLEAEAETRGLTREELIAAETAGRLTVTEDEITTFYQQNQSRLGGRTLEELYGQIAAYLQETKRERALADLAEQLAATRDVVYLVEPFRAEIDVAGSPAFGPPDALVTIVEFSDFECPYCQVFAQTLQQVKDEYGTRVRIVFRHFPLNIHPNAPKAAEASLCADEQGKFWEMHDLLFEEQRQLQVDSLIDKAERLGLDVPEFEACLDSGRFAEKVGQDVRAATRLGVDGTPAVFINGMPVAGGAVGFEALAEVIEEELARARSQ